MSSDVQPAIQPTQSRLLVTSADPAFRWLYMSEAASPKYCVEEALSGAHALAKMSSVAFDTLILDRRLPDLVAQEVADRIKFIFRQPVPGCIRKRRDARFPLVLLAAQGRF